MKVTLVSRDGPKPDFGGHLIPFIAFSCKKFLITIVCYRKSDLLGGYDPHPRTGFELIVTNALNEMSTFYISNEHQSHEFITSMEPLSIL